MKTLIMTMVSLVLATQVEAVPAATLTFVNFKGQATTVWSTVSTKTVPLPLRFPEGASQAVLTIRGLNHGPTTVTLSAGTKTYAWQAFDGDLPDKDDIYTLTLAYSDGLRVLGTETARLAVLRGSFGMTCVKSEANTRTWQRLKGNAVIPYSALWSGKGSGDFTFTATPSAGGAAYQDAAPPESGWFGFGTAMADAGLHHLALTRTGADTLAADVVVVGSGLFVTVR